MLFIVQWVCWAGKLYKPLLGPTILQAHRVSYQLVSDKNLHTFPNVMGMPKALLAAAAAALLHYIITQHLAMQSNTPNKCCLDMHR
jgi:hypothetical protein